MAEGSERNTGAQRWARWQTKEWTGDGRIWTRATSYSEFNPAPKPKTPSADLGKEQRSNICGPHPRACLDTGRWWKMGGKKKRGKVEGEGAGGVVLPLTRVIIRSKGRLDMGDAMQFHFTCRLPGDQPCSRTDANRAAQRRRE